MLSKVIRDIEPFDAFRLVVYLPVQISWIESYLDEKVFHLGQSAKSFCAKVDLTGGRNFSVENLFTHKFINPLWAKEIRIPESGTYFQLGESLFSGKVFQPGHGEMFSLYDGFSIQVLLKLLVGSTLVDFCPAI